MKTSALVMVAVLFLALFNGPLFAQTSGVKNIVLVHGAFADGSGWDGVYKLLTAKGYTVTAVQNPLTSMEEDVAAVNRALDKQDGPVILVGHSYGGAVITEAGVHAKVVGLVYVDGFMPDAGESALDKAMSAPDLSGGAVLPPDAAGFIYIDKAKFHSAFCADLPAGLADFMASSQAPVSVRSFAARLTQAAWKTKPSWGIVGTGDKSINPVILRAMYARSNAKVTEISGASHVSYMSHPKEVAEVIMTAAKSVAK